MEWRGVGEPEWDSIPPSACAPDALARLTEAMNAVAQLDWASVPATHLMELRETIERLGHAANAVEADYIATLDTSKEWVLAGHRGVKGCLRAVSNRSDADIAREVAASKSVRRMPIAAAAHRVGLVGRRHLAVLHGCTARWYGGAFDDDEARLVGWAVEHDWVTFVRKVEAWKEEADLRTPSAPDETDQQVRSLHHSRSFRGRGLLDATLTPVAAEILDEALRPIIDEMFTADWRAARALHGDDVNECLLERTPAQRRHDAFNELCRRGMAWNGTSRARPLYVVHLTLDDMRHVLQLDAGLPSRPPPSESSMRRFGSGFRVTPTETVRGLMDATVRRIVFDSEGEVLDYGRGRRLFSAAQKQAMAARDHECICGCGLRADVCEADHQIDWVRLGTTDLRNGQSLCPPSHRRKTDDPSWKPPPRPHRHWTIAGPETRRRGRGRRGRDPRGP